MPMARMRPSSLIRLSAELARRVQSAPAAHGLPLGQLVAVAGVPQPEVLNELGSKSRRTTRRGSPASTSVSRRSQPCASAGTTTRK